MGLFNKLFRKKKNEIHLTAEEAFAVQESIGVPDTTPVQPDVPDEDVSTVIPDIKKEESMPTIDPAEQAALRSVFYFHSERIEDAAIAVREAARTCARSISESSNSLRLTLSDDSILSLERHSLAAGLDLPEVLTAVLSSAPPQVKAVSEGLNQKIEILPLHKGNDFEASFPAFLDAFIQQLQGCKLTESNELICPDKKLLLDSDGNTDLYGKAEENEPVPDSDFQISENETDTEHPEAENNPAAEPETESPRTRADRSRSLIQSHGINPDCQAAISIDEAHVYPRSIKETVERISALAATAHVARAYLSGGSTTPASRSSAIINRFDTLYGVRTFFTPKENAYLRDPGTGRHAANALRLEAAAALLWALGFIELDWPDKSADADAIGEILKFNDINLLCSKAKPRDREELLDMYDLTVRLHALCVRTGIRELKEFGLDPDIIYERHYALNWLLGIGGFISWDSIIPTT